MIRVMDQFFWKKKIGRQIKKQRLNEKLTVDAVAERFGVSRQAWAKFEKGTNFEVATLVRIAKMFKIKVVDLLADL